MLSLRSCAIPKHQIMIWVYFLIGLKVDWLSNSKHPLFYLKIQPGETLLFLNCFANWLLREVITSNPGDWQLSPGSRRGGGIVTTTQDLEGPSPSRASSHACALQYLCLDLNFEAARKDAYAWSRRPLAAFLTHPQERSVGRFSWATEPSSRLFSAAPARPTKRWFQASNAHSPSFGPMDLISLPCHLVRAPLPQCSGHLPSYP